MIERKRRTFSLVQPLNQDITIIKLIEHRWVESDDGLFIRHSDVNLVLTTKGWVHFNQGDILPMADLPFIDGLDMMMMNEKEAMLDDLQEMIKMSLVYPFNVGNESDVDSPTSPVGQQKEGSANG